MDANHYFSMNDTSSLANICRVAADKFKENADQFRALIDKKPSGEFDLMPHGEGARRIAEQFDGQAAQAREFASIFGAAQDFSLDYEADDEEDADATV